MIRLLAMAVICLMTTSAFAADRDMTCAQINAEMEELNNIQTAAGDAALANDVAGTAGDVAVQGGIMAGSSSIPFIGGIAGITKTVTNHNERRANANAEQAEKRLMKLETMAEMKDCQ